MPKAMVRAWLDAARETDAVEGVNEEVRRARAFALAKQSFAKALCLFLVRTFCSGFSSFKRDVMSEASQVY